MTTTHALATAAGINAIADQIRPHMQHAPRAAILLGTGLGGVAEALAVDARISYSALAGMPQATAESHAGEVLLGTLAGLPVVAFSGRLHCYEGHDAIEVAAPVRIAKALGADTLLMGSAVGGMSPYHQRGDLVLIEDHINLMGVNPLVGPNDDALGPRWPDMIEPYSKALGTVAQQAALAAGIALQPGVYVGVLGPNLETRAEYRMLRTLGADVVGMSTVPEAIAAVHAGMRTVALAIVTDLCLADALEPVDIQAIIGAAAAAEPSLTTIMTAVCAHIATEETNA